MVARVELILVPNRGFYDYKTFCAVFCVIFLCRARLPDLPLLH